MKKSNIKSLLFAMFCGFYALCATAAVSLFSDYGQIQNVQNYSTNPFWTPNSPYNQRMPQPVYVQGADLTAEDCFKVVQSLVSVQCMARDNCKNTSLAEIRPTVMVQLSNLPGNNYVSACSGYIDGVFESYVAQYGNTMPNRAVAFPTATTPNPALNDNNKIQIQNPYKQVVPKWQQEIKERSDELQQLQKQNGAGSEHLSATAFPTTYADLTFSERIANATEGYEPYKDLQAYVVPKFLNTKEWCEGEGAGSVDCEKYEEAKRQQKAEEEKKKDKDNKEDKKDNPLGVYGIDYMLPWYSILVVKKGSLDEVYKLEVPVISPSYMKEHKDKYFPANSNKALGMAKGCTHGNHTAHDKDVINRAAHMTFPEEEDSFWKGNDYYVYDGEDVYWGTAVVLGEIALTLLTLGISAEAQSVAATKAGIEVANAAPKVVKSAKLVNDTKKIEEAAKAASAITKTSSAAEKASAIKKLGEAGVQVSNKIGYLQLNKIGSALTFQKAGWVSTLIHGSKWSMLKNGVTRLTPKAKDIFNSGASLGRTLAVGALAYGGVKTADSLSDKAHDIFIAILKANGYSTSSVPITDDPQYKDLKFNSFGLLSADDIEGHENDISHGTWLMFDKLGEINSGDESNPGDAENEAAAFAEEFAKNVRTANAETPLCDVDIYVVQPVIGDPLNKGKKDIYYWLYTDPTANLRVESH